MKKRLVTLLLSLLLISTVHAADTAQKKSSLQITDINGKTYTVKGTKEGFKISGTEGKVVFLEFFGYHCPPCLASIPHLIDMKKRHKDKIAIFAVEVQGSDPSAPMNKEQLRKFVKQKGINYTVFSDTDNHLFTTYVALRAQWQGSIPFLIALDTKGEVQFIQAGMLPEAYLEELFQQLSKK